MYQIENHIEHVIKKDGEDYLTIQIKTKTFDRPKIEFELNISTFIYKDTLSISEDIIEVQTLAEALRDLFDGRFSEMIDWSGKTGRVSLTLEPELDYVSVKIFETAKSGIFFELCREDYAKLHDFLVDVITVAEKEFIRIYS